MIRLVLTLVLWAVPIVALPVWAVVDGGRPTGRGAGEGPIREDGWQESPADMPSAAGAALTSPAPPTPRGTR